MSDIAQLAADALSAGNGVLRLAPARVPRSFLQSVRRLKLHTNGYYAMGIHRGGIDERWFGSTTKAANDNGEEDEGLSYCAHNGEKFLLREVVSEPKGQIIADAIWSNYEWWPVYSKFFDNMEPVPNTCTRTKSGRPKSVRTLNRMLRPTARGRNKA